MFENSPDASSLFDQKIAQREGRASTNETSLPFWEEQLRFHKRRLAQIEEVWRAGSR